MQIRKGFRFRIYPSPEQIERLSQWEDTLRLLWNIANEQRLQCYNRPVHKRIYRTAVDQINELTPLRKEFDWIADVPRNVSAQLLVELDKAWQRCFKKLVKQPRWKKKGRSSIGICEPHPKVWHLVGNTLRFPKIGKIPVVVHRPIEGTPKTCTIKRDGDQWFVSISCVVEIPEPVKRTEPRIGLDRGVVNLFAGSDGRLVENPRYLHKAKKRLARAQRVVARRKKGSKNQDKAKSRVARLHRKIRRQRQHVLHVESSRIANSHGRVVVEKLEVKNMSRSAKGTLENPGSRIRQKAGLNRAILDSGWYAFENMLRYKLLWSGGKLVEVRAAYSGQVPIYV